MRVVADSHAIVWDVQGSSRLSEAATSALAVSERTEGIVVSVATLVDLWYVTQISFCARRITSLVRQLERPRAILVDVSPRRWQRLALD